MDKFETISSTQPYTVWHVISMQLVQLVQQMNKWNMFCGKIWPALLYRVVALSKILRPILFIYLFFNYKVAYYWNGLWSAKKKTIETTMTLFISPLCPLLKAADVSCIAFICMHAEAPCLSPYLSQTQRSVPSLTQSSPGLVLDSANSQHKCWANTFPNNLFKQSNPSSKSEVYCISTAADIKSDPEEMI